MGTGKAYQLRHAAGRYWLLDMQQEGPDYQKPVELNECAALIWKWNDQGKTQDEIAQELHNMYEIPMEQAKEDTQEFIRSLKEQGLA